jgi:hypothetical protein
MLDKALAYERRSVMVTKILKTGGAITLGLLLLGAAPKALAAGTDSAAKYEQQAAAVQASIDETAALKAANIAFWRSPKVHAPMNVLAKDKEYADTIAALEEKKEQWMVLARLHKAQALEGEAGLGGETAVN